MNPLVRCVCGRVHIVQLYLGGVPLVICPFAPPDQFFLMCSDRLPPAEVKIPRPEVVW